MSGGWLQDFAFAARMLRRDWRAGELTVLIAALLIAVSAMTGVAFLTDRVGQAVELRAAESLAADLRLRSTGPIDAETMEFARSNGMRTARVTSMPSVVFSGEANTLAAVRAVTEGYPLRGELKTAPALLQPESVTLDVPPAGEAWASPRLMARLGVDTGATVEVGAARLRLSRVLAFRPDEGWSFVDLAPTLLINEADLAATELVQPGSRVAYRALFSGDRGAVDAFKPQLEERLAEGQSVSDIKDTNPQIRSSMDRAGRFLNLASLVSVLLAAVAVAKSLNRAVTSPNVCAFSGRSSRPRYCNSRSAFRPKKSGVQAAR